jgi:SAM-dependent methyltransferase
MSRGRRRRELEGVIYNEGERLIPGVTHDRAELIRHRSSYVFWRDIINADGARGVSILDLGCGVGHGCVTLAKLRGTGVVGVDSSAESLAYAQANYRRRNVRYVQADMRDYLENMRAFDYVVSRGAIEHVPNGLTLLHAAQWRRRLMFDVPYDEPTGRNPHHVVNDIREESFSAWEDAELFFQDLDGVIHSKKRHQTNVIGCVASAPDLPRVADLFQFPVPAWGQTSSNTA